MSNWVENQTAEFQDGYGYGYNKGRRDKYNEITSEYMLLTEEQVQEIRAEAVDECIEALGNNIWLISKLEQLKEKNNDNRRTE